MAVVRATTTDHFSLHEGKDLVVQNDNELAFSMPAVPANEPVLVEAAALASMNIFACTVPGGCTARFRYPSTLSLAVLP